MVFSRSTGIPSASWLGGVGSWCRIDVSVDSFRFAVKSTPAGHHLVEHHSEREDVRARIHRFAFGLLGGHVGHGAQQRAFVVLDCRRNGLGEAFRIDLSRRARLSFANPKSSSFTTPS
jgi:hypothetical protein